MAAHDRKSTQTPQMLLLAAVTLLAAASGVAGLAREAAEMGPRVGDLLTFNPARAAPFESTARLTADRPGQQSCVLDLSLLQRSGGSLIVEQSGIGPDRLYRLHWAGPRTSDDATNCGSDADLLLPQTDINTIAMASGSDVDAASTMRLR